MSRLTVFMDLDGTVLDCQPRYYACYEQMCRAEGLRPLPPAQYWEQKRRRLGVAELFARSGGTGEPSRYLRSWIGSIEQPRHLALDDVYPGVREALAHWAARGLRLFLVTLRRDPAALAAQLERLSLTPLWERVIVCDPRLGAEGKAAEATRDVTGLDPAATVWIGDTEVDAAAATKVGCSKLYLVTCGIRDEPYLRALGVGEVVAGLSALRDRLPNEHRADPSASSGLSGLSDRDAGR